MPNINGIFEFNMTVLNSSIPYTMRLHASKPLFNDIDSDYFVGGYPTTDRVELGSFLFYAPDTASKLNITFPLYFPYIYFIIFSS